MITRSQSASASRAARNESTSSAAVPSALSPPRTGRPPSPATAAARKVPFDSKLCPRPKSPPGATSSSPVAMIPTTGRRTTSTSGRPAPAAAASALGESNCPAVSTVAPAGTSSPRYRTWAPLFGTLWISTCV